MIAAARRLRQRGRDDRGMSLTELLFSMAIFSLLMAITFGILISVMTQTRDTLARQQSIREAQLGIAQIDRQVRSGNVVHNPFLEDPLDSDVPPFYSMRIFTQESGAGRCAQWRVIDHTDDGFGNLEFRTWNPLYPASTDVTPWSIVAHDVVETNIHPSDPSEIDPTDPATHPPFWMDASQTGSDGYAQSVKVTLRLKNPGAREDSKPIGISTTLTGRNTVFGYPNSSCSDVPPP